MLPGVRDLANPKERREHLRVQVRWPVSIETEKQKIKGESRNMTVGGLFVCCEEPLLLNALLRISIMPPDHEAIHVTGKVIWSDLYGIDEEKDVFAVGVCLVDIAEEDKQFFNEIFDEMVAKHNIE